MGVKAKVVKNVTFSTNYVGIIFLSCYSLKNNEFLVNKISLYNFKNNGFREKACYIGFSIYSQRQC